MRTFRCFDTPEVGCTSVCEPGGCGCSEAANGDTYGADPTGNKTLRAYARRGIEIDEPPPPNQVPIIAPFDPQFTSEQADGSVNDYASHTRKRFPSARLTTFDQASCYTPSVGEHTAPTVQTFDRFGCPGLDPHVFPNNYTSCGHVIEGAERGMIRRVCTPASQGSRDVPVSFNSEGEYDRMAFVHSEPCIVLDNTRAFGNLYTFGGGVGFNIFASPVAYNAWTHFGIRFNGINIRHVAAEEPFADPDNIALQNEALNLLNNAHTLQTLGLDRISNQRIGDPNAYNPNKVDEWMATYDALAPGSVGCAGARIIRTMPGRFEQAGCPVTVDWVLIFAQIKMSLLLYHVRPSKVFPTIQLVVHMETALRIRGTPPCSMSIPWQSPNPVPVMWQPCIRVPRTGTNIKNERLVTLVHNKDTEPPRFIRWKGELGPETTPPWTNVYAFGGGNDAKTCCMAYQMVGKTVPAKNVNPAGVPHWQGYATIDPNVTGNVDAFCASQAHSGCQTPIP